MGCGASATDDLNSKVETAAPTRPARSLKIPRASLVDETVEEVIGHGSIVCRCTDFLKKETLAGGQTACRSPLDPASFEPVAGQREALYPEFVRSLEKLHAAQSYTDDSSMESLLTVCQMSDLTDTKLANELVEKKYPELFVKIWNSVYNVDIYSSPELKRELIVFNLLKQATISFTHVSWMLCGVMGSAKHGIVPLMAKEFDHPLMTSEGLRRGVKKALWNSPRETLKNKINILANIIRMNIDNRPVFREANIVPYLQDLLKCRFMIMRAKALFCLVYLINEDENEALNTTYDNINFVLKVLGKCLDQPDHYSDHYKFSAEVVVNGIVQLPVDDSNQLKPVKNGVLPKLITMLKTDKVAEKRAASKAVWKLAFNDDNKREFKTNDTLISVLAELRSSETDPKIRKACSGVFWKLDISVDANEKGNNDKFESEKPQTLIGGETSESMEVQSVNGDGFDDDMPHVMISYQWAVQQQMIKVKELLREAGYRVWMDVDGWIDARVHAAAVERSAVVLVCFTEKYKRNASCLTEAEYTYKLQKPIIPLRLQPDYDPDGWLGIMIGTKLYVDMSTPDNMEDDVCKLKQQLGDKGRMLKERFGTLKSTIKSTREGNKETTESTEEQKTGLKQSSTLRQSVHVKNAATQENTCAKAFSTWTNDGYTGQRLLGRETISTEAPEFFYSELKKDLGFKNLLEIVTFKQALDAII